MPRSSRYLVEGRTFHLTHRCHNRRFLLNFSQERKAYREWLRIAVQRYDVPVFGFCITKNHVHIIAYASDRQAVGRLMQLTSSVVATQYNTRKKCEGSVWEHPYQCTMIEDGQHLLNCLRYVDLNMVRCGAVKHPDAWPWCGYDELVGTRKRYRIIDIDQLLERLNFNTHAEFSAFYAQSIREQIESDHLARQAQWTEALAVGGKEFISNITKEYGHRKTFERTNIQTEEGNSTWMIQERSSAYITDSQLKPPV